MWYRWGRKYLVLQYYDDAQLVLSIVPDFPQELWMEIPKFAHMMRAAFDTVLLLRTLENMGFRFDLSMN